MEEKMYIPAHVAIIMDGNRRWAQDRKLFKNIGHREGMYRLREIVEESINQGIKILTVYAFSTENWGREINEVNYLLDLLIEFSVSMITSLDEAGVRINIIGEKDNLPVKILKAVEEMMERTSKNDKLIFNIAFNYGSRTEIINAVKKIAENCTEGKMEIKDIDEESFKKYLYTGFLPDPDLMIRTSGEIRLSNFLLYQMAYSEFYFTDIMWPDFNKNEFRKALYEYQQRNRRFGKK